MTPTDPFSRFIDGGEFGDLPYGLEDLDYVRDPMAIIAFPPDAPAQLKRNLAAAAKTFFLRNKSIDRVLKNFGESWRLTDGQAPEAALISDVCLHAKSVTRQALERLSEFFKPAHTGTFVSWAVLYRLQATIRTAVFPIRQGFHFESATILRLFLEQLAWIAAIHRLDDIEAVFATKPQSSLSALKPWFPRAGKLYGYLSQKAHITPEQTRRYILSNDVESTATLSHFGYSKLDAYALLALADWYVVLSELVIADHLPPTVLERRQDGQWILIDTRPSLLLLREFEPMLVGDLSDDLGGAV